MGRTTSSWRVMAVVATLLFISAMSPGLASGQEVEVVEGEGDATAVDTSGPGWELRRCKKSSTPGSGVAGNLSDKFRTTDQCMAVRLKSPVVYGNWTVTIRSPSGNPTGFCTGQPSPCLIIHRNYGPYSEDVFWYIKGAGRVPGTYTVEICTTPACTTMFSTTFRVVKSKARFRSVGSEDGWVLERSETASTGRRKNSGASTFRLGDDLKDRQYRSILSFDTSSIPNNAVITKVTLRVKRESTIGRNPFRTHQPLYIDIRKGLFGGNATLESSDFQAPASRNRVGTFGNTSSSGWYTALLSSSGRGRINLRGITQFRLRFKLGDNDDLDSDFMSFYSGNTDASAKRPELIVEYYVP